MVINLLQSQFENFFKSWDYNKTIVHDQNLTDFYQTVHRISRNPRLKVIPAERFLDESFIPITKNQFCK